jgi:hypothetical protein
VTTLKPFTLVTRAAAIAEFAGTPIEYCDGQVVIVGSAILLFATVGTSPQQTRLVAPDRLEWRPARNDYHPDEKIPWLPAVAIPLVDHDRAEWLSYTHILVQPAGAGDEWLYCGPAHLGSYSYAEESTPPGPGGPALYSFDAGRLPAQHWPALRGYRGWEVTVEGTVHYLSASDRAAFSTLLQVLQDKEMTDVEIARWEGDAFSVYLNRERGSPAYHLRERYASSELYVVWDAQDPWAHECFASEYIGLWECPRHATLSREAALSLLMDFFERGEPPRLGDEVPVEWSKPTLFPADAILPPTPPRWSDSILCFIEADGTRRSLV